MIFNHIYNRKKCSKKERKKSVCYPYNWLNNENAKNLRIAVLRQIRIFAKIQYKFQIIRKKHILYRLFSYNLHKDS